MSEQVATVELFDAVAEVTMNRAVAVATSCGLSITRT
jgi:hypothetical protein